MDHLYMSGNAVFSSLNTQEEQVAYLAQLCRFQTIMGDQRRRVEMPVSPALHDSVSFCSASSSSKI